MEKETESSLARVRTLSIWERLSWWYQERIRSWKNHGKVTSAIRIMKRGTEQELRDIEVPWPHSERELLKIIRTLAKRQHDYGTCVYAMSISALASYYYISHVLGVTGFQASCADLDFLGRTRHMKNGFRIVNYDDLLYPQYRKRVQGAGDWEKLIADNKDNLRKIANQLLIDNRNPHPDVRAHWERLANT